MKSIQLLKTTVFLYATFLFSSCLLPEDVVDSSGFEKPVKIISVSPDSAYAGDNIIITGENFIPQKEYNQVWFSGNVKGMIDSATKTQLFLKVPEGAVSGDVVVSNGAFADTLRGFKIQVDPDIPTITSFTPEQGYEGSVIVYVHGNNFGSKVTVIMGDLEFQSNAYNDQLSFILPQGVKTGKICIKNQKGKTGCSQKEFTVLKGNSNLSATINGIKIIRNIYSAAGSGGGWGSTTSQDTINTNVSWSFQRCRVDKGAIYPLMGGCIKDDEIPYSDDVLQCLQYKRSNGSNVGNPLFRAVKLDIDTVNMIVKNLLISEYETDVYDDGSRLHRICKRLIIGFSNTPCFLSNGKVTVKLDATEIAKYNTKFEIYDEDNQTNNWGGSSRWEYRNSVNGIHEILPDAYFELTLE